jgi:polyhydroxyalkanoate synthase
MTTLSNRVLQEVKMPADGQQLRIPTELLRHAQFAVLDVLRRAQGEVLGAIGFDPPELAYEVLASGHHWRLRDYGGYDADASLLIVAAPIKRPYIWNLAPAASAIHFCINHGLHVYLIEWIPTQSGGDIGFDECVKAISECAEKVASAQNGIRPFLIGHSRGGTLAAIFSACEPRAVRGLLLLSAPICFRPESSNFRDALVSIIPPDLSKMGSVPGSLLSQASAFASPHTSCGPDWSMRS